MLAARTNGFEVGVIYISVPTVGYSIERIRTRVSAGGHDVPEDRIRARWPRSHDNLMVFATIVDQVFVFSNAGVEPVLVAEKTSRGESLNLLRPDELPEITYRLLRREG